MSFLSKPYTHQIKTDMTEIDSEEVGRGKYYYYKFVCFASEVH